MRQMRLVLYKLTGPGAHLWRHPGERNLFLDPDHWDAVAKTIEAAKFDAIFMADGLGFHDDEAIRGGGELYLLDPVPLAMSIARSTRHLGIGITVSTSFVDAYGVARALGTVDLLSGGRLAWNVVTSSSHDGAQRFGMDRLPGREERYDRAEEVVDAAVQLWESFGRDALVMDKAARTFIDPAKLRQFDFVGKHVKTKGPLTTPPSPQGRPVIIQAGSSERGREFAARWAEIIFTAGKDLGALQAIYADLKGRLPNYGRTEDECAIISGLRIIVGETETIAREKQAFCDSLLTDEVALSIASKHSGVDLYAHPKDAPFPENKGDMGSSGLHGAMYGLSHTYGLTTVEVARRYATFGSGSYVVGSPEQVADRMQLQFESRGSDGFMLQFPGGPGGVEDFCRLVVPILQERGLFRTEYPGTTLRETLGLSRWPTYPAERKAEAGLSPVAARA